MRVPEHAFKWIIIACLVGAITGVSLGKHFSAQARESGIERMNEYMTEIAHGICRSEGYDGGAMIDFIEPARSRCFTAKEGRDLGMADAIQ